MLDGDLLNVDVNLAADADIAAPIAGAVAANANVAAPIDAAVGRQHRLGRLRRRRPSPQQDAIINQHIDGRPPRPTPTSTPTSSSSAVTSGHR